MAFAMTWYYVIVRRGKTVEAGEIQITGLVDCGKTVLVGGIQCRITSISPDNTLTLVALHEEDMEDD